MQEPDNIDVLKANRERGNKCLRAGLFTEAVYFYNKSIGYDETDKFYFDRATALLNIGAYEACVRDCTQCLLEDWKNSAALEMRAEGNLNLHRYRMALSDTKELIQRQEFLLASRWIKDVSERCLTGLFLKSSSFYKGPRFQFPITAQNCPPEFITDLLPRQLLRRELLPFDDLVCLLENTEAILRMEPNIVGVDLTQHGVTVVGDLHGQYGDLLRIFSIAGYPSETNHFIFNGDFVDRGQFSLEVLITLFFFKCRFDLIFSSFSLFFFFHFSFLSHLFFL